MIERYSFRKALTFLFAALFSLSAIALHAGESPSIVNGFPVKSGVAKVDARGGVQALYPVSGFPVDLDIVPSRPQFAVVTVLGEFLLFSEDGERLYNSNFESLNDVDCIADRPDRFLLTSRVGKRVFFFDLRNSEQTTVPFPLEGPTDADLLPNGNLLVCDASAGRIVEISQQGDLVWSYEGDLKQPTDALRLANGETAIADFDNHRVLIVSPEGRAIKQLRGYDHPFRLTHLESNSILVVDADQQEIEEIDAQKNQRVLLRNLNHVQAVSFLPKKNLYYCVVQDKFPPPAESGSASEIASVSTSINGIKTFLTNRYLWLLVGVLIGVIGRVFAHRLVVSGWAFALSYGIVLTILYNSQLKAASSQNHRPPEIFWAASFFLCAMTFRDAFSSYWPKMRWADLDARWKFPLNLRETIVLAIAPILTLLAQYYSLRPFWGLGRLPWYVPMALWGGLFYWMFRRLFNDRNRDYREHSAFQLGPVTIAVPFSTGSVSLDEAEEFDGKSSSGAIESPLFESWANAILIVVIVLGAALYIIGNTSIPFDVHGDEAEVALYGMEIRDSGNWNFFNLGWYKIPNLFFLIPAWGMWLFGDNVFGVRMVGALIGVACIPLCYITSRRLLRPVPASIATFLFATSTVFIHFSRIGIGYNQTVLVVLAVLYGFARGVQDRDLRWFALAGFLSAVGFLSYQATKITLPLFSGSLVLLWVTRALSTRGMLKGAAVFTLAFWVGIAPLIGSFCYDSASFFSRAKSVTLMSPEGEELLKKGYPAEITYSKLMAVQVERSLLAPFCCRDRSPYLVNDAHGGMLDTVPAILLVAGIVLLVGTFLHPASCLLLFWILSYLLVGSALTDHAPSYQRVLGATPLLAIAAAPVLNGLLIQAARAYRWLPRFRLHATTVVLVLLLVFGMHRYFHQIASKPQLLDEWTRIAHYLDEAGPTQYTYFFGPPHLYFKYGTIRFVAQNALGEDVTSPEEFLKKKVFNKGPVCFLLVRNNRRFINDLRRIYPGGREENHFNSEGGRPFTTYVVNF